jgi:hypothetical protein
VLARFREAKIPAHGGTAASNFSAEVLDLKEKENARRREERKRFKEQGIASRVTEHRVSVHSQQRAIGDPPSPGVDL